MRPEVYVIAPDCRQALDELLLSRRIVLTRPKWVSTTVYDSFDGRLHAQGLRLEASHGRLVLAGEVDAEEDLQGRPAPQTADDVHPGPLRNALESVLAGRALLPQAVVLSRSATGKGAGLTVRLHERIHIEGHPDLSVVMLEVAALPRTLQRFAAALAQIGVHRSDDDTVTVAMAGAGRTLAGHQSLPTAPLHPAMSAAVGFRAVLADLATVADQNWDGALAHRDSEFLHDLRVAVRRSRSVLKLTTKVLRPRDTAAVRDHLAWVAAHTSRARDLDVWVLEWDRYVAEIPQSMRGDLLPLKVLMEDHLDREYESLSEVLGVQRTRSVAHEWRSWLADPDARCRPDGELPFGEVVASLAQTARRRVVRNGRAITKKSPAQKLHDLRKDAKQLRYLLECCGPLFDPQHLREFVRSLKRLQDNLGEHQDAEVHVEQLKLFAGELADRGASPQALAAVSALAARLDRRRARARREFHRCFAEFDSKQTQRAFRQLVSPLRGGDAVASTGGSRGSNDSVSG